MTTTAQACVQADLLAFFAHDDRDLTDPIVAPDIECSTDEDTDTTPFGGTR